jgi:hypothetical protein
MHTLIVLFIIVAAFALLPDSVFYAFSCKTCKHVS